jgi:Right handed beta helix region
MKLQRFLFTIAFVVLCCAGMLQAQTVYVNSSTGSDATGTGSSGSPYKTFNKGYNMVSVGGTIDATGTFTWTDVDETGDAATSGYTIAKNITIQGHVGQTIVQAASSAGSANCRVFTVNGAYSVTFNNLEIRYGYLNDYSDGGGINLEGSATITISNCYIHHNTSRQGAGICIMTASVVITNSTIANNNGTTIQTGVNGGGICQQGTMPLTITNTTICNNYIYGYGGGINSLASNTTTITNCSIVNNTSNDDGGGISIGGSSTILQIKNTIIANNTSTNVPTSADVDMFSGTLTDNGYNIVEVGTGTFTATGDKTGNQANLFGTGISATPSLALNNSVNGTPTLKTTAGSVAIMQVVARQMVL